MKNWHILTEMIRSDFASENNVSVTIYNTYGIIAIVAFSECDFIFTFIQSIYTMLNTILYIKIYGSYKLLVINKRVNIM